MTYFAAMLVLCFHSLAFCEIQSPLIRFSTEPECEAFISKAVDSEGHVERNRSFCEEYKQ